MFKLWKKKFFFKEIANLHKKSRRHFSHGRIYLNKNNLILMGSPGCGKTTVGRVLSDRLRRPVLDIDDHHLEPYWGIPVSQKLDEVGSDGFVEAEGEALTQFEAENCVVSLTGSNPMHDPGMAHVASTGTVIFLDVHMTDILERLERMKVNRIVGQNDGTPMADILKYRQQFYEKWYDIRILCERNEPPESIAEKILTQLDKMKSQRGYASTRGHSMTDKGFNDVLLQGLAPDRGLIVPRDCCPKMTNGQLSRLIDLSYADRALRILELWIDHRDLHPKIIKQILNNAYGSDAFQDENICPIHRLNEHQFVQELFHGPTASFKDMALQVMPQLFMNAVTSLKSPSKYMILVATSGDTGGAVLDGFTRHALKSGADIGVLVLYPLNGISEIQAAQMISYNSDKARVIGVSGGDFDFCQTNVKKIFADDNLVQQLQHDHNLKLSAANSISWGRLLPQVIYHVSSYLDLVKQKVIAMGDEVDVCVPTGNFGNILSAYYAKEMGIPFRKLICASNSNNVISEFISTGRYDISTRKLLLTSSPAIDILVSSNMERLLYSLSGNDPEFTKHLFEKLSSEQKFQVPKEALEHLQSIFHADWCSEEDCAKTIRKTLKSSEYLLDPHTSVAKAVSDRFKSDRPMLITATAHPGKFAQDVLKIIGVKVDNLSPHEMVRTLGNYSARPSIHRKLLKTLEGRDRTERNVCEADYDSLVKQVATVAHTI